jgi:hypothetical protein
VKLNEARFPTSVKLNMVGTLEYIGCNFSAGTIRTVHTCHTATVRQSVGLNQLHGWFTRWRESRRSMTHVIRLKLLIFPASHERLKGTVLCFTRRIAAMVW